jgi:hypothetical protein
MGDHESRNTFRALARASEGAGHDVDALKWYGKFVEFGSQSRPRAETGAAAAVTSFNDCVGCHVTMGPRDQSFFRDWYAGRKFGEYAVKTGEAPRLIAAHETVLSANPASRASRLSLAYLYEATGATEKAEKLWAGLGR